MSTRRTLENISSLDVTNVNLLGPIVYTCHGSHEPRNTGHHRTDIKENSALSHVIHRLERLEEHCGLEKAPDTDEHGDRSLSLPFFDMGTSRPVSSDISCAPTMSGVIGAILSRIKNPQSRALLLSNVFSHLRTVESCFFENERCVGAIAAAMSEIEYLQNTPANEPPASPEIPNDLAKKIIQSKFCYQFEGFKIPLDKNFLLSIPDLLENPHIQLDYTSQIIYHTVRLQGIILDLSSHKDNGGLIRHLYRTCLALTDSWLDHIQNTPADLFAAVLMASEVIKFQSRSSGADNVPGIDGTRKLR
ncbi:hypothetical protein N7510_008116 [Penicillium lagena]|uniref:uncharacterized protein n=1 Tax=Penicillium lagena TaxID=94218 RepID=UPI00254101FC|nr:uncharacterized protein N7510_008116 [Penicillium lagena]KAJ5611397.1 hypothetical protein N7510_008116 [Penicillium lagena]